MVSRKVTILDFTRGYGFWKDIYHGECHTAAERNALIIANNKILATQLHSEFKEIFPENAVATKIC